MQQPLIQPLTMHSLRERRAEEHVPFSWESNLRHNNNLSFLEAKYRIKCYEIPVGLSNRWEPAYGCMRHNEPMRRRKHEVCLCFIFNVR